MEDGHCCPPAQGNSNPTEDVKARLGRLGVNQSSLSPRIAALILLRKEQAGGCSSDTEEDFVVRHTGGEGGEHEQEQLLLRWDRWRKTDFLSSEEEETARLLALQRERQSAEWVEAYFGEFSRAVPRIKRAALFLHRHRLLLLPPPSPDRVDTDAAIDRSRASLLVGLRWLRPRDGGWELLLLLLRHGRRTAAALAMLTSYLEKALGDLLCWSTAGRQRVPCRINDLLAEPALERLLGADAVFVVRCLVGPPNGLNLRNLVWHGFIDPDDGDGDGDDGDDENCEDENGRRFHAGRLHPAYLDFLMVLIASLGDLLGKERLADLIAWEAALHQCNPGDGNGSGDEGNGGEQRGEEQLPLSVKGAALRKTAKSHSAIGKGGQHRRLDIMNRRFGFAFKPEEDVILRRLLVFHSGSDPTTNTASNGVLASAWFEELCTLFARSRFVLPQRVAAWTEALRDWTGVGRIRDDYLCLLTVLPELEHGLRRVFVAVNAFAEPRLLTAEAAVYYTTLDIMTAQRHDPAAYAEGDNYVSAAADAPLNLLPGELGPGVMHLLRDLHDWAAGPRLRIKVSHGFADRQHIHPALVDLLFVVAIALCARYDPCKNKTLEGSLVRACVDYVESYQPRFHPVSVMQRDACHCFTAWKQHLRLISHDRRQTTVAPQRTTQLEEKLEKQVQQDKEEEKEEEDLHPFCKLVEQLSNQLHTAHGFLPLFSSEAASAAELEGKEDRIFSDPNFGGFQRLHKRVYCSKHEESVVALLVHIIALAHEVLDQVAQRYRSLGKLVAERKAYHQQRTNFARLQRSLAYFGLLVQLTMLMVERIARTQDCLEAEAADAGLGEGESKQAIEQSPTFTSARSLQDLLGRQLGCVRNNEWDKAREIMAWWMGDDRRTYHLLSNRERVKFRGTLHQLLYTLSWECDRPSL